MRIVHAIRSNSFAGVERHVVTLALEERRRGHDVVVIGGQARRMRSALGGEGWLPARTTGEVARGLRQSGQADVIHAHMTAAEVAVQLAYPLRSSGVVTTRHFAAARGASAVGLLAAPVLRRRFQNQIAVSRYVANRIDGASTVVHAGLPSMPSWDDGPRVRVLLAAQRLSPEKDVPTVIEAFRLSGLAMSGWQLHIAGDGNSRATLESTVHAAGLGQVVRFWGRRSDITELMRRSGLLIAAAPAEHFGLTVVEAMGAGLPVVAAGSAGHLETIGRVKGASLFEPGDARQASRQLIALARDEDLRTRYANRAKAVQLKYFTVERQAREVEAVYTEALA